jgi:hypothetical protein
MTTRGLERLTSSDALYELEPKELALALEAWAGLVGPSSVARLAQLIDSGFTLSSKKAEAQIAAARVLGAIGTPEARAVLERGRKSLKPRLRDACTRALMQS